MKTVIKMYRHIMISPYKITCMRRKMQATGIEWYTAFCSKSFDIVLSVHHFVLHHSHHAVVYHSVINHFVLSIALSWISFSCITTCCKSFCSKYSFILYYLSFSCI
jgi:hypothetical protein